ncbi:MAG: vWA domain-containing protein, partial [Acidobacteriota bacterium]
MGAITRRARPARRVRFGADAEALAVMPELLRPHWLLLALPRLALVWLATRRERSAFRWLERRVGERFRPSYTAFASERAVRRRGWWLSALGVLLAVAAAGPSFDGEVEVKAEGSDVVILLDASQSMYATDVDSADGDDDDKVDRFTAAVELARRAVEALPDHRFAIFTFSGAAAPEMAMTSDRVLIEDALFHAEPHTIYQSPGSSFAAALDVVLPFTGDGRSLQALILSDGEQPFAEDYGEALAALVGAGVPVHAAAVGTREGQGRSYKDVDEDEREFKVDYTTRRVDRHLEEMADRTGGVFTVAASYRDDVGSAATAVAKGLRSHPGGYGPLDRELASGDRGVDRGRWALGVFLLLFLVDVAVGARRRRPPPPGFDLDR